MNLMRWRRIALTLARHASGVLPRARSSWAEAMRRELDYIEDDRAALHWAIGCVVASYAAQFAVLLRAGGRVLARPILAGGMLLSIALALGHAASLTEASVAPVEKTTCGVADLSPAIPAKTAPYFVRDPRQEPDVSCADRHQPVSFTATRGLGQ
jgi:hypothetical protein